MHVYARQAKTPQENLARGLLWGPHLEQEEAGWCSGPAPLWKRPGQPLSSEMLYSEMLLPRRLLAEGGGQGVGVCVVDLG